MIGKLHSIETFGAVDGPGIRFVVFLKGCQMRCQYCHNPDTWTTDGAEEISADDLLKKALRYKGYWGKLGGITVSGGEALLQLDFITELFEKAKEKGVHTALDTSGQPFRLEEEYLEKFNRLMAVTDLFILDIKHIDEEKHRELTGHSNQNILSLARYLSDYKKSMWIRHVLVPGVTDAQDDLEGLRDFVKSLTTVRRFEVLPYHTFGNYKWDELGIEYSLKEVQPPSKEQIELANRILETESMKKE